jgi:hypothetical protein
VSIAQASAHSPAAEGHRAAVTASFLGWTLDAFDFFLVPFALTAIAKEFAQPVKAVALSITITLMFRPVGAIICRMVIGTGERSADDRSGSFSTSKSTIRARS